MSEVGPALGQIAVLMVALAITVPFLARLLAHTYTSEKHWRVERLTYRALRLDPDADQHWRSYALSVLGLSLVGVLLLYAFGRLQQFLPLSLGMSALPADGAWNTAISFVTNTNWQWYSGEAALGHLMQASGLTVQNFVSAAVGMSVAAALARGLARGGVGASVTGSRLGLARGLDRLDQRRGGVGASVTGSRLGLARGLGRLDQRKGGRGGVGASGTGSRRGLAQGLDRLDHRSDYPGVGNFWRDLVRTVVRVLLPIAFLAALLLVVTGVVQNLADPHTVTTLTGGSQAVTGGPVASQEAIKELGTNGGGFYNANSSHPFENPSPLSNLLEIYQLLVIPFSMAWAFGLIVRDRRQGVAVMSVMGLLLVLSVGLLTWAEMAGPGTAPQLAGSALEGKEVRFGTAGSALFAAATTGTSTGAVNSMHDSLTAPGGGVALFGMMLGEVSPGGVGSGLYGMLVLAIVTVFLSGLMVGRTPEYLGKKVGHREIVLVAGYVVLTPALVLIGSALALSVPAGLAGLQETGPHGLSEAVYAVTSASNNNGSAFAGLTSGTPFWNTLLGLCMLLGRFVPMVLVLALAGRFAAKAPLPAGAGTLPTHRPLFVGLLASVTLVVVGLTYVPVLALGPLVESL